MKKMLCLLLTAALLVSIPVSSAITADAAENLCDRFSVLDRFAVTYGRQPNLDLKNISFDYMLYWVVDQYKLAYNDYKVGAWIAAENRFAENYPGYESVMMPADKYDAVAHTLFDFEGKAKDIAAANTSPFAQVIYKAETDSIIALYSSAMTPVRLCGYVTQGNDLYDVYFQLGTHSGEGSNILWDSQYIKLTAQPKGPFTKVVSRDFAGELPSKDSFVTPDSLDYRLEDGIKINGDGLFPAKTVVTAKKIEDKTTLDNVRKTVGIAHDGNVSVFEITATGGNGAVQPSGKVKVVFNIPQTLSADNLKLYYIGGNTKEEIAVTVDAASRTATAELQHFSMYALCNPSARITSPLTGNGVGAMLCVIAASVSAIGFCGAVICSKKSKEN